MHTNFRLSVSPNFHNKQNNAPERWSKRDNALSNAWAYASFTTVEWPAETIISHVTSGKAICVAALSDTHRHKDKFVSAQLMGVDFDEGPDVDGLLLDAFVQEYAFLVYRTPSHTDEAPRTRALFLTDTAFEDADMYRRLLLRLLTYFQRQNADEVCKDQVRIFYGSDLPGYSAAPSTLLPLAELMALPPHPSEMVDTAPLAPAPRREVGTDGDRLRKYADVAVQRILDTLGSTSTKQNNALNIAALQLGAFAAEPWSDLSRGEAETLLYNTAVSIGYVGRDGEQATRATIRSGMEKGLSQGHPGPKERLQAAMISPAATRENAPVSAQANGKSVPMISPPEPLWKTSDDSMAAYKRSLTVAGEASAVPLLFPFEALKDSGGFCVVVPAGIMIGVVGLSGGMKTSFVETITDKWRQMGHHILWWGPEWDWQRMGDRAVQRYGGARMADKLLHEMWLSEDAAKAAKHHGKRLSDTDIKDSIKAADMIASWPGKSHYIEKMDLDITELLDASDKRVTALKEAGTPIRVAVFDYVQLLNMRSVRLEGERITQVLGMLKGFCVDHKIVGVCASQVTKYAGSGVREGSETLDAEAGQFLRSDKFNLVLTLNPIYSGSLITSKGIIRVAKNSIGQPLEQCVAIDPSRFQWVDRKLTMPPKDER